MPSEASTSDSTHVYTDGACSGNPGPGGWAWAVVDGPRRSGGASDTTNQRMELTAVLDALRALDGPVVVHSDSTYVVNCFNDKWYEGWLKKNWRNSQRKPVANRDLWEPLVEIFQDRESELTFVWVKGHSGDVMNDLVDQMAVAEVDKFRSEADAEPGRQEATRGEGDGPIAPWPIERAVAVTGPTDLDPDLVQALNDALDGFDPGFDIIVSGLRRGAELAGAEGALQRGIPIGVVLPFEEPAARWPQRDRDRFNTCVASAEWVVTLDGDPGRPGLAVGKRNQWLWSAVVGVVVVSDPALVEELDQLGLGVIDVVAD